MAGITPLPHDFIIRAAPRPLDAEAAWRLVLAARDGGPGRYGPLAFADDGGWQCTGPVAADAETIFELYLPLLIPPATRGRPLVVALLGQSLDGRIATLSGHSHFVNCDAALTHLHRMRALCDAVLVGAGTVALDDPKLNVRRCEGRSPLRVVFDPDARAPEARNVFRDGRAPTLVLRGTNAPNTPAGDAEIAIVARDDDGRLCIAKALDQLAARGLRRILVEGGGHTVSRFLEAKRVDRLQLAVAPMVIGSGRPSIALPPIETLADALRPPTRRVSLGADMLFECRLGA
jgi:diaminohydroxyphosphoribosylaminopyrimidine deaminase / 5-amino-6-(5-phosphoribosylamino)uracil reductase